MTLTVLCSATGQHFETNLFTGLDRSVPDGSSSGIESSYRISSQIIELTGIRVRLKMMGDYNGDLYVYLRHTTTNASHVAVLLNRPGRSKTEFYGYADEGVDIVLRDDAAYDVHTYGEIIVPPLGAPLTGEWQPDSRYVDPYQVTTSSSRLAFLSNLNGMEASGEWTLFVADVDAGGTNTLASWGLELSGKLLPGISWDQPEALIFGNALTTNQLNASSAVAGTFIYNPPLGAVLNTGSNQILTVSFSPDSSAEYTPVTKSVSIDVMPKELIVTSLSTNKYYGETLSFTGTEFSATGLANGDTITNVTLISSGVQSNATTGSYAITPGALMGNLNTNNYTISYIAGQLTVDAVLLSGTADAVSRSYGETNPVFTASYSGFVNGETTNVLTGDLISNCAADTNSPVGEYAVTLSGQSASNYTVDYTNGTLSVLPADLAIVADDATRAYGATNPVFTVSYSGFMNDEGTNALTGTLTFMSSAETNSPVGEYAIVPDGLTATNYTLAYTNGTLSVSSYALLVTAESTNRFYGAINPELTGRIAGLQNGDHITVEFTTLAEMNSPVGPYEISISLVDPDGKLANYAVSTNAGQLMVDAVSLSGIADAVSRSYGETNPVFSVSYSGFVNGDNTNLLTGELIGSCAADTNSPVGEYVITVSGQSAPNYTVEYTNGMLSVLPADLAIVADDAARAYGATNPVFTANYSGFMNGEGTNVLTGNLTLTSAAETNSPVGDYAIVPDGLSATNYTLAYTNGILSIVQASSICSVMSSTKMAPPGSSVQFFTYVGAYPPSAGIPSGEVKFKIDDTYYGMPVSLDQGFASLTAENLARGLHTVTVEYSGDQNFIGSTNSPAFDQLIDGPPLVASVDTFKPVSSDIRFSLNYLLSNCRDIDGGPVSLEYLNTATADGGSAQLTNGWIVYTPPPGGMTEDAFSYSVQDNLGVTSTGEVTILSVPDEDSAGILNIVDLSNETYRVQISGVPWGAYMLQSRDKLVSTGEWHAVNFSVLDDTGLSESLATSYSLSPKLFYRAVSLGNIAISSPCRANFGSSETNAAPGENISFYVDVEPWPLATPEPQGTIQFKLDGTNFGNVASLEDGLATLSTSELLLGRHQIGAEYGGDDTFSGFDIVLDNSIRINMPYDLHGANSLGIKMPVNDLISHEYDPDEGAVSINAVHNPSAEGGNVMMTDGWVHYIPPNGPLNIDSFTYSFTDSFGAVFSGVVNIIPAVNSDPLSQLLIIEQSPGTYHIQFSGVPWRSYSLQYSEDQESTTWTYLAALTADSQGLVSYVDTLPEGTAERYYSAVPDDIGPVVSPFQMECWENFITITNNRSMDLWAERSLPPEWPNGPPLLAWNSNSLIYGMEGMTAISQCNDFGEVLGRNPVTLITRRHAYLRGHAMGANGLRTNLAGKKVWFCTADNTVVGMTVAAEFIRVEKIDGQYYDYGLLIFTEDVPMGLSPISVMSPVEFGTFYYPTTQIPYVVLGTEQYGHVASYTYADPIEPFVYNMWKPGDSGSPDFIISPDNKLIMLGGRGCSRISTQLAEDVNILTIYLGLDPALYQLNWYDLSRWLP